MPASTGVVMIGSRFPIGVAGSAGTGFAAVDEKRDATRTTAVVRNTNRIFAKMTGICLEPSEVFEYLMGQKRTDYGGVLCLTSGG